MMGKDSYDSFEQDFQLAEEEFNERQGNSHRFDSHSMKILSTNFGDIKVSEQQENLQTFSFPTFDIQEFLFGDCEDLADVKHNNHKVVDQYLASQGLPSTAKMNLSSIPTEWLLNIDKDGTENQDDGISYPCSSYSSTPLPSSPLFDGMTHNNRHKKAGSTKKSARNHPYAKRLSEKKQEKKQKRQAELPQSDAGSSYSDGLDADDGSFGEHSTDQ